MIKATFSSLLLLTISLLSFAQHNQWNYQGEALLNSISGKEIHKYKVTGTCLKAEYSRWIPDYWLSNVSNVQSFNSFNISCNYDYTTSYEFDNYGNIKITLTVTNIPDNATIEFTTNYVVGTRVRIKGFNPIDLFPPETHGFPSEFLQPSPNAQSDNQAIKLKTQEITSGISLMVDAVEAIAKWIDGNIVYRGGQEGQDAVSVFSTPHPDNSLGGVGSGNCRGFTNLMIAMLRSVGIPARYTSGQNIKAPFELTHPYGKISFNGSEDLHAIYEVFYPSIGWVSGDAQGQLHFKSQDFIVFSSSPNDEENYSPISSDWWFPEESGYSVETLPSSLNISCGTTTNSYNYKSFSTFSGRSLSSRT